MTEPRPASEEDQMEARLVEVLLQTAPLMLDTMEWRDRTEAFLSWSLALNM